MEKNNCYSYRAGTGPLMRENLINKLFTQSSRNNGQEPSHMLFGSQQQPQSIIV